MITSYHAIFDSKLKRLKEKLKEELKKSKDKRDKRFIKDMLKEAQQLKKTLKKINNVYKICCPNCKHEFNP